MTFNVSFIFILVAGIMNGSFVVPTKKLCVENNADVWKWHSVIGMIIVPWMMVLVLAPHDITDYFRLDLSAFWLIVFGGMLFGIGQFCFSYAIECAGVALSFAVNLGIGIVIGSLFTLVHQGLFFSLKGMLVIIAVFLILFGLVLYYFSSKKNKEETTEIVVKKYRLGWLLAVVTGVTSGCQNIVFVLASMHQKHLFQTLGVFWVWPVFFTFSAIPMIIGFSYKSHKKNIQEGMKRNFIRLNQFLKIVLMGFFFTGSLILYSKGVERLNAQQLIIAWPVFMVTIILTTQFWGNIFKETVGLKGSALYLKWLSIVLMMTAIVIFSLEL